MCDGEPGHARFLRDQDQPDGQERENQADARAAPRGCGCPAAARGRERSARSRAARRTARSGTRAAAVPARICPADFRGSTGNGQSRRPSCVTATTAPLGSGVPLASSKGCCTVILPENFSTPATSTRSPSQSRRHQKAYVRARSSSLNGFMRVGFRRIGGLGRKLVKGFLASLPLHVFQRVEDGLFLLRADGQGPGRPVGFDPLRETEDFAPGCCRDNPGGRGFFPSVPCLATAASSSSLSASGVCAVAERANGILARVRPMAPSSWVCRLAVALGRGDRGDGREQDAPRVGGGFVEGVDQEIDGLVLVGVRCGRNAGAQR